MQLNNSSTILSKVALPLQTNKQEPTSIKLEAGSFVYNAKKRYPNFLEYRFILFFGINHVYSSVSNVTSNGWRSTILR